jgi:UDP-N-acetylglucosamine/UDP-N-acetylgalactosamine diphosphorylase
LLYRDLNEKVARDDEVSDDEERSASRAARALPPSRIVRRARSDAEHTAWHNAARRGRELLVSGRVGVVLVAGGHGTRLGFSQPKGLYPVGPVSGATLYQLLAEQLLARSRQSGVPIPYFVMTSDATHAATCAFFARHEYFGLDRRDVFFFQQENMPAVDARTGQILLAEKAKLSSSPDGHGGLLGAISKAGLFDEMRSRGIDFLYYHQVDNPTAIVCDPAFLGWHAAQQAEVSTKIVVKSSPEEKMGLVVDVDGKTCIIEYSDLPDEVARKTDESGKMVHWAGNTAIHVFNREFLERIVHDAGGLPYHAARKKVSFIDETGNLVVPTEPNAIKFERFIFDVLPRAERALVVEADRAREFNPVKNESGPDSPESARQALCEIHRQWLRQAGAIVDDDAPVEISPLVALEAADVTRHVASGTQFRGPVFLH